MKDQFLKTGVGFFSSEFDPAGGELENKEVKCQDAGWRRLVDTSQLTMAR